MGASFNALAGTTRKAASASAERVTGVVIVSASKTCNDKEMNNGLMAGNQNAHHAGQL